MANRNYASGGKIYSMHVKPVLVDCKFTVSATDSAGLGQTNLRGPMVQNVFMHTSATPGQGNSNPATPGIKITNPNPASGTIMVQLQDAYNQLLSFRASMTSPSSGTDVKIDNTALTPGVAYTITTLGNSTAATWYSIGVPKGLTPAVGVNFIATSAGGSANVSTSRVQATATAGSGIDHIEMVPASSGDIAPIITAQGSGAQFLFECYSAGVKTAPAAGTVLHLEMYLLDSSVTTQGE